MAPQTPVQRLIAYALAYERSADDYRQIALDAAAAEAQHKASRAKAILAFKASSEPGKPRISQAEAETRAEADDHVADLYMTRLTTAALVDAHRQKLFQMKTMTEVARTVVASDRVADQMHAGGMTGAA